MWISYTDSEVNKFHPVCEKALNKAIERMGMQDVYKVIHHKHTGNLEMDYCVQNQNTGKYLCVVEVKRTPADVNSSRYQFQAMSYVQENSGNNERPFYILTNLEFAIAFRYDAKRPKVFQQMLEPGIVSIGKFEIDEQTQFEKKLIDYFFGTLSDLLVDKYDYLITLEEVAEHMEQIKDNPKLWKSYMAILMYEYIRGVFKYFNRNELKDVRLFKDDVERVCNEAIRVNFKDIFTFSSSHFEKNVVVDNEELVNVYDFGYQNITGDAIAGLLHQIVSAGHEQEGEVPTDLELGRLIAELAKNISGNLNKCDLICDPAAGSGNLISSTIDTYRLAPDQILVNDINSKLLEILSLRIGLNFAKIICKSNSPIIENKNIADLDRDFFAGVKVIVMNPPFVAGINCVQRKQSLYRAIKKLTGTVPVSDSGQMPFEAVFLELITNLVAVGTTIACVFPKTHLMARGKEAQIIRKLIINNLGLHTIFIYPGNEIFDDVTKDTCVLIGKAMQPAEYVDIISSYEKIPNLDIHKFAQSLRADFFEDFHAIMPGVEGKHISIDSLKKSVPSGWRELNSEISETVDFVRNTFGISKRLVQLSEYEFTYKRGTVGNKGASDLLFFDTKEELYSKYLNNKDLHLKPSMRNAKLDTFEISDGDAGFLDFNDNKLSLIKDIIDTYLKLPTKQGKQRKESKSPEELKKILETESRFQFNRNAVLIPRNIRRKGRIYLSKQPLYVSTNFFVFNLPNEDTALILSTWMSTIFYQLLCEISSKDQEGTRKMELKDILETLVPDLTKLSDDLVTKLKNVKGSINFVDLQSPSIRTIDRLWANEIFGSNADSILLETERLLGYLARRRNCK